jgi:flagellar hook capping protein FlgD/List-Bact-rpt repeat protein
MKGSAFAMVCPLLIGILFAVPASPADRVAIPHVLPTYTITTAAFPDYGGTTSGDGVYDSSATVLVQAVPHHGFLFTGWSDGTPTASYSFPAETDLLLTAFFESAPDAVTFDFDSAPVHSSFPLDLTVNGLGAHFAGNYSIQPAGTLGFTPLGFSGLCVYPNSVFASDLAVDFSEMLSYFSVLYAVDELACDSSATMRVTVYRDGVLAGTNTTTAPVPGTYPSGTLTMDLPAGFNRAVVHWVSPGVGCQDYGPIFLADNVTVTRLAPVGIQGGSTPIVARLRAAQPSPFLENTSVVYELAVGGPVELAIYDVSGRLLRVLVNEVVGSGPHTAAWDGTDDAGRRVPPGIYLLSLTTGDQRLTRRVVKAK